MNKLIHILGSDISHHNITLLHFFNETLATTCPLEQTIQFMIVSKNDQCLSRYIHLNIEKYSTQQSIAKALLSRSLLKPEERYFLHGQFNYFIWLLLFLNKIASNRISWHVWGGDLYEDSRQMLHKMFYLLRRQSYGKISHVFATRGDLKFYHQYYPSTPSSLLYFPTRLAHTNIKHSLKNITNIHNGYITLLIGNSGDPSNRHIQAIHKIYRQFGSKVNVIIPMGYPCNNHVYINKVLMQGNYYFSSKRVNLLNKNIEFNNYLKLLSQCDIGYFLFQRQQGIGTLSLLIQLRLPFVISRHNTFSKDLVEQGIPVLYDDEIINYSTIQIIREKMLSLNLKNINFFYPNIINNWRTALSIAITGN